MRRDTAERLKKMKASGEYDRINAAAGDAVDAMQAWYSNTPHDNLTTQQELKADAMEKETAFADLVSGDKGGPDDKFGNVHHGGNKIVMAGPYNYKSETPGTPGASKPSGAGRSEAYFKKDKNGDWVSSSYPASSSFNGRRTPADAAAKAAYTPAVFDKDAYTTQGRKFRDERAKAASYRAEHDSTLPAEPAENASSAARKAIKSTNRKLDSANKADARATKELDKLRKKRSKKRKNESLINEDYTYKMYMPGQEGGSQRLNAASNSVKDLCKSAISRIKEIMESPFSTTRDKIYSLENLELCFGDDCLIEDVWDRLAPEDKEAYAQVEDYLDLVLGQLYKANKSKNEALTEAASNAEMPEDVVKYCEYYFGSNPANLLTFNEDGTITLSDDYDDYEFEDINQFINDMRYNIQATREMIEEDPDAYDEEEKEAVGL